jgi:hypothetical protein
VNEQLGQLRANYKKPDLIIGGLAMIFLRADLDFVFCTIRFNIFSTTFA